jgi:hypothetical protein
MLYGEENEPSEAGVGMGAPPDQIFRCVSEAGSRIDTVAVRAGAWPRVGSLAVRDEGKIFNHANVTLTRVLARGGAFKS